MESRVSVIVPVYNAEKYLTRCVQTILEQHYNNYEIIIVDDGSTDDTRKVAELLEANHSCVRLLTQSNSGVSTARNRGLKAANGDYCCFVDSDDYLEPDYLRTLVNHSAPGVLSVVNFSHNAHIIPVLPTDGTNTISLDEKNLAHDFFNGRLGKRIGFSVWNKLFDMQVIRCEGIAFEPGLPVGEDMIFVYRFLCRCRTVCLSPQPLYHYTIRSDSVMNARYSDLLPQYEAVFEVLLRMKNCGDISDLRIISDWAADVLKIILTNCYVVEMDYSVFRSYYQRLLNSELAQCVSNNSAFHAIKKDMIRLALRCRKCIPMFILIRMNSVLLSIGKK